MHKKVEQTNKSPETHTSTRRPLAYLITISCYGARLHGDPRGSIDRFHNQFGAPLLPPNPTLEMQTRRRMLHLAYVLDQPRRTIVRDAVVGVCSQAGWELETVHVRRTHLHAVVAAAIAPQRVIGALKGGASRRLNQAKIDASPINRWARGGSKRYLWTPEQVDRAVEYVLYEQGRPMSLYCAPRWRHPPG